MVVSEHSYIWDTIINDKTDHWILPRTRYGIAMSKVEALISLRCIRTNLEISWSSLPPVSDGQTIGKCSCPAWADVRADRNHTIWALTR